MPVSLVRSIAGVLVGCGLVLGSPGASEAEIQECVVGISLHGVSVRFEPAEQDVLGLIYRAEIGSSPAVPMNGELMPLLSHEPFTHGGYVRLTDPTAAQPVTYGFGLNIPSFEDQNANGLHDFFETAMAVERRSSKGAALDPVAGERGLSATWSRAAGEAGGLCLLRFEALGIELAHPFRLVEYHGRIAYTNTATSQFTGWLTAADRLSDAGTLEGSVEVLRIGPEALDLKRGTVTNGTGATLAFQLEQSLQRLGIHYVGFLVFDDGWPATPEPDFTDFVLIISDPRDANGNGVPDISEPVRPEPARLSVSAHDGTVWLTLEGTVGFAYAIETTSVLGSAWVQEAVVVMKHSPETVRLPAPWSGGYWRAVAE